MRWRRGHAAPATAKMPRVPRGPAQGQMLAPGAVAPKPRTEPPATPPVPGGRREHPMVCGATLLGLGLRGGCLDHVCVLPPAPLGAAGKPEHRCHCGATWIERGKEGA